MAVGNRSASSRNRCHIWNGCRATFATARVVSPVTCPPSMSPPPSRRCSASLRLQVLAPRLPRRELLHAGDAQPVSVRPGRGRSTAELDAGAIAHQSLSASERRDGGSDTAERVGGRLEADVLVRNLGGHKLPTAYPSRRVWLAVTVENGAGRLVFSSGQVEATGAIAGNDNDQDGSRVEPHYCEIRSEDQVQIYEAIMATPAGTVTTGVLSAVSYVKDNRLLPRGFDKRTVPSRCCGARCSARRCRFHWG